LSDGWILNNNAGLVDDDSFPTWTNDRHVGGHGMMMRTVTTIATIMMTTKAESDSQQELFHVPEAGCVAER
jgi:hypothetical protein